MTPAFSKEAIAAVCLTYGAQVGPLPQDVHGSKLLWGISGCESSFGADVTPRHEPVFDTGGKYGSHAPMPALIARYGSPAAACSYGPWQIMLCNAQMGGDMSPEDFADLKKACAATVLFLNSELRRWKPSTLEQIGQIWNTGRECPDPAYTSRLAIYYAAAMPAV